MRTIVLALLLAAPLAAQDLPDKPIAHVGVDLVSDVTGKHVKMTLPAPHRTADRAWWAATIISAALTVADVENSMHAKNSLPPGNFNELDPLFGHSPGRARYYGILMPYLAGSVYLSFRAKRTQDAATAFGAKTRWYNHWWDFPVVNSVGHAVGIAMTIKNTGY